MIIPPGYVPPAGMPVPVGPAAVDLLKRAGKMSFWLLPALAAVDTMLANEAGMARAATRWKAGVGARLDDGVKQLLPQLIEASRNGWVALDQDEFERVIWIFHREIGVLRTMIGELGGMIDEVAAAYRSYFFRVMGAVAIAITLIAGAKWLQRMPHTALWGGMVEKVVAAGTNSAVAVLTLTLASTLNGVGDVMSMILKKEHQFGYIEPTGDAAIDFGKATLRSKEYPSYREPDNPGDLPSGYRNFDWVAPAPKGQ